MEHMDVPIDGDASAEAFLLHSLRELPFRVVRSRVTRDEERVRDALGALDEVCSRVSGLCRLYDHASPRNLSTKVVAWNELTKLREDVHFLIVDVYTAANVLREVEQQVHDDQLAIAAAKRQRTLEKRRAWRDRNKERVNDLKKTARITNKTNKIRDVA